MKIISEKYVIMSGDRVLVGNGLYRRFCKIKELKTHIPKLFDSEQSVNDAARYVPGSLRRKEENIADIKPVKVAVIIEFKG